MPNGSDSEFGVPITSPSTVTFRARLSLKRRTTSIKTRVALSFSALWKIDSLSSFCKIDRFCAFGKVGAPSSLLKIDSFISFWMR